MQNELLTMPRVRLMLPAIAAIGLLLAFASISSACPMCKDSIPNNDALQAGSVSGGFNNSIYLFLIAFITMVVTLARMIIKVVREQNARPGFAVIPRETKPTWRTQPTDQDPQS